MSISDPVDAQGIVAFPATGVTITIPTSSIVVMPSSRPIRRQVGPVKDITELAERLEGEFSYEV